MTVIDARAGETTTIDPKTAFEWASAERAELQSFHAVSVTKEEVATLNQALETAYKWVDMQPPVFHEEMEGWFLRRGGRANDSEFREGILSPEAFKAIFGLSRGFSAAPDSQEILLTYAKINGKGTVVMPTLECPAQEIKDGDEVIKVGERGFIAGKSASAVSELLSFSPEGP